MTRTSFGSIVLTLSAVVVLALGGCEQSSSSAPAGNRAEPASAPGGAASAPASQSAMPSGDVLQMTLTDTNGSQHSLAGFKGKYVVLEWLNHDCPFVRKHYDSGNMQKLQASYTAKDVVWLSVVSSAPGKQGHFPPDKANELTKKRQASPTAVVLDGDGALGRAFGAKTTPHMIVLGPDGNTIYNGAIDDKPMGDVVGATNYVSMALDAALAGEPVTVAATTPYGCSIKY